VLGWIQPEAFLGGQMQLRPDLARQAMVGLARDLNMSVEEAAAGTIAILVASMVQSIEENSVRKGYDPRDFVLVASGGAGPLFAAEVGREVGTPKVLVPTHPGIMAATGLLATNMVYEYVRTNYDLMSALDRPRLTQQLAELEAEALDQLRADGIAPADMLLERVLDCRYVGQGYELRVTAGGGAIDDAWLVKLASAFHDVHEREYSRRFEGTDIQIVNVRVRGIGLIKPLTLPELEVSGTEPSAAALRGEGDAWFRVDGELRQLKCRHYDRAGLRPGNLLRGPAIVNQFDSTIVIPHGMQAEVDRRGHIIIDCLGR
jgi:N-methylhydantoinase A/oxoprolinase/acetone carboxylase beta subunit